MRPQPFDNAAGMLLNAAKQAFVKRKETEETAGKEAGEHRNQPNGTLTYHANFSLLALAC